MFVQYLTWWDPEVKVADKNKKILSEMLGGKFVSMLLRCFMLKFEIFSPISMNESLYFYSRFP